MTTSTLGLSLRLDTSAILRERHGLGYCFLVRSGGGRERVGPEACDEEFGSYASNLLQLKIVRLHTFWVHRYSLSNSFLEENGMRDYNVVKTPMNLNIELSSICEDYEKKGHAEDQQVIGRLFYLARGTRPDFVLPGFCVTRFCARPG
mmetsp:Transcript_3207/g.6047  ORF Transcript_3207/g.6047 Transcript_3207/m.6047 type:complete len:148 (-) Transcript_3207:43-486(-)